MEPQFRGGAGRNFGVSKGSHRRRAPRETMPNGMPDVQVRLFIPSRESESQSSLREKVMQAVGGCQWTIVVRRSRQCRVIGGEGDGRPYDLVEPRHAAEAYSVAHRSRVLMLSTGTCFVRRNPSANPSHRDDLVSIESFVRYKAAFGMIRDSKDVSRLIEEFSGWPLEGACSGPRDPRVLPLHTFDSTTEWPDLDQPRQIAEFAKRFGPAARRTDPADRSWRQSPVFHGGDALSIAGYRLNPGFHWDVERGRGRERIFTAHEVWKLTNQNSYCNIYPDGYVRKGRELTGGSCRLVWSAAWARDANAPP
jgi:hypothetical protein